MPSISYYEVPRVRSEGSSVRCVQLRKALQVKRLLLLRSSTKLLTWQRKYPAYYKISILLERNLM